MRNLLFALILSGCGSNSNSNNSCPAPSPAPQCLPACLASWLSSIAYCAPMGTCTKQTLTNGSVYCFSNGVKISNITTGNTQRNETTLNGVRCIGSTTVINGGGGATSYATTYDPGVCGSLVVKGMSGSSTVEYDCNSVSHTVDPSNPGCQADLMTYEHFDPSIFTNCTMGTC